SPLAEHRTADRSVVTARHRDRERQQPVLARNVVLPAAPRDRVAWAHEKAVTEVLGGRRVGDSNRTVEHAERDLSAAVGNVEQEPAITARGIDGPQQIEVRGGLAQAIGSARRQRDIRDRLVRGVRRIDAEAEDADDLLVGAGLTERTAVPEERAGAALRGEY